MKQRSSSADECTVDYLLLLAIQRDKRRPKDCCTCTSYNCLVWLVLYFELRKKVTRDFSAVSMSDVTLTETHLEIYSSTSTSFHTLISLT